jgi:alanyl-tRNA synthetase
MDSNQIRKKFLDFFEKRGHKVIPSSSLIPENDPSVLFTTAGMHPLVPYLLGEPHPLGKRLVDVQKCIRTGDIDEVGDYCHHTFFEMLGNWSLGDYFKKEVIGWSYEFMTSQEWLGLDKNRIAVSVFKGDENAPFDIETFEIWKSLGISENRIAKLPKKNNWWGPVGETGPCGPDTEIFYWTGDSNNIPESFNDDNPLWCEVWNDVFMQYNKNSLGKFEPLSQVNVDTGMGLERTLAVVNGFNDNYKTELFLPIIEKIENLSNKEYKEENIKAMRIVADHIKAATFILGDNKGILPSNSGQGYVLRRLIRRAIRYGNQLGLKYFTREVALVVLEMYKEVYPEVFINRDFVINNLEQEEIRFEKTLINGLKELEKGTDAFTLFASYGFPIEMTEELAKEKGQTINRLEFDKKMKAHQDLSRTSSAGMFKGGLANQNAQTIKLHTTHHLLLAALQQILGKEVKQKGSNITEERLRIDFVFPRKLTDEEKEKAEDIVNNWIKGDLVVVRKEMPRIEAETLGAEMEFGAKYPDVVSIYFIEDKDGNAISKEFCGGPHVEHTGVLGVFKIQKEEAVSAGVRRIKATLQ